MVDLVVVGSVAFDTIKTPFGTVKDVLSGAATHASLAASFFARPGIVAVVGDDFSHHDIFNSRNISTDGLSTGKGRTFRWSGYYEYDMNQAHTVETQENVFKDFSPQLPDEYKKAKYLFLANISPELHLKVLEQMENPIVIMDTMNYWIERTPDLLMEVIKKSNIILLNDAEAREIFKTPNLILAGKKALDLGLDAFVVKKGEHGVLLFTKDEIFSLPGYPCETVKDPTGAGDSFAGAFTAYLAKNGFNNDNLKKAVVYGSTLASFIVEDFSFNNLNKITMNDIEKRYNEFRNMIMF